MAAGLGLSVMVGWWTHNLTLIQVAPELVGMRFNTALGFTVAGAALILLAGRRLVAVRALGLFLLLLGGLSFLEVAKGWDFGIDEVLMKDYLPMGMGRRGLMAGNTALSFVAFGTACLATALGPRLQRAIQGLCIGALLGIGGLSLLGYAAGVRTFLDWGSFPFMALHTAVGMLVLGFGLLLQPRSETSEGGLPAWLPLPFVMALVVATLVVWKALDRQERALVDRILDQEAVLFGAQLREDYEVRRLALGRMAARWERAQRPLDREEWEADAGRYVQDMPGYRALEWVGRDLRIRWVVPLAGNEQALNADLSRDIQRRQPYAEAAKTGAPVSGPDIDLLQGGRGFIHCMPVRRGGRLDGYVAAVFGIRQWLEAVWTRPHRSLVEVHSEGQVLFSGGHPEQALRTRMREMDFAFEGRVWRFRVYPTPTLLKEVNTPMPKVVLGAGLAIAALLSLLFQAAQRASANARRGREINLQLQAEARERLRAEEALKQASAVQTLVLQNATVGIGLVVDRKFQWINHQAAEMVGVPYETLLGGPTRLIYPDDEAWAFIGREGYPALARGEAFETELQLRRPDGSSFWCRFVGKALDPAHPHEGSIWMFEDINARVASERMKREFVSTVSHELRTPLTAIRGSLGLLRSGVGGSLDAKGEDLLGIALGNCDRLVRLVNEILDLEKLRSGRLELEMEAVDLGRLLGEAAGGNLGLATQAGVLLALEPPPSAVVHADPHRLRQVVDNLISNAVKFSPRGSRVDLAVLPAEGGWTLLVEDQGRGIPEAFLPRLFEPFTQADATDAREKGGTGLGLSISKALVEGMGGRIRVESDVGKGTRFLVDLRA